MGAQRGRVSVAWLLVASMLGAGCSDRGGSGATEGLPPPPPAETTGATTGPGTTSSGTTAGLSCPCPDGQFCAAPVDVGADVPEPEPDDFVCRDTCIPTDSANLWCFDAQSCCDPQATCELGFCRAPEPSTSGTTAGDSTTTATGPASTGSTSRAGGTSGTTTGRGTSSSTGGSSTTSG